MNRKALPGALSGQYIRKHRGASADLPVFRSNTDTPRYRFDTYGELPSNFRQWNAKHLGAGGAFGYTDNIKDLIDAIRALNRNGVTAPICETLFEECRAMGASIVESRDCPNCR